MCSGPIPLRKPEPKITVSENQNRSGRFSSDPAVTVMVQLEYVPALSVLKVMVFDQLVALLVALLQEPPYVILPASFVVKV